MCLLNHLSNKLISKLVIYLKKANFGVLITLQYQTFCTKRFLVNKLKKALLDV